MAPRSSILAWEIPRTEEPGGLQSTGFQGWQEPGVYSRVTAGMSIRNSSLFIEVRILSM